MVKHLPKALLLALLIGIPAMAQTLTWESWRDAYFGANRPQLIKMCALGRKMNLTGKSYWDPNYMQLVRQKARNRGGAIGQTMIQCRQD